MIRILLVDSDTAFLDLAKKMLQESYQFRIEGCPSAAGALERLDAGVYDAVIADHAPGGMDGIAFLEAVRSSGHHLPFLFFTAGAPDEMVIRALNGGADYLLRKGRDPVVRFPELAHAVRTCVQRKRRETEERERECALGVQEFEQDLNYPAFETDTEGVVQYANPSALATFGWDASDLERGLHFLQMISSADRRRAKDAIWWTVRGNGFGDEEYAGLRRDGAEFPVAVTYVPIHRGGAITGVRIHIRNNSALREARCACREFAERLDLVIESANLFVWDWDVTTNELTYTRQTHGNTGREWEAIEGRVAAWEHLVHPDDLPRLLEMSRHDFGEKTPYFETEIRLKSHDGGWRWIQVRGKAIERDGRGCPVRITGFFQDISDTVRREKILREREAQFRTLFYKMNCGGAIFKAVRGGMDFVVTDLNYAGETIEGDKKFNVVGKSIRDIYDCSAGKGLFKEMAIVWQTGKPRTLPPLQFDHGKSPQWREYYIYILPTGDIIAIYNDITDRIEAQNQILASLRVKETLIKEVHHRVKNNLQVIASILKLQSLRTSDPMALDVLRDCRNRVFSIAMIHEGLYRSNNLARIPIGEYIRSLGEHLINEYYTMAPEVTLAVDCDDDITLDIDRGIPCGLIIGELVTNSLKYAFRKQKTGEVRIAFTRSGGEHYRLIVKDNGAGFPSGVDFRNTESLGMQLVCSLTEQLGGTIALDAAEGTEFVIVFPVERN
jgi:PAS domain S-box-containing protein